jgi:transposase
MSAENNLTLSHCFLQPANSTHRQYEALRAFFVEGLSSSQVAQRFGYTPGSFRVLAHHFRQNPQRAFFLPPTKGTSPTRKGQRLRQQVIALRKQNLSIYDINRALNNEGHSLSPVAVSDILKTEGFARLPRRRDEERPQTPRPEAAQVADVRQLDLSERQFHTQFGGLFLLMPLLVSVGLDGLLKRAGFPGSKMVPAPAAMRSLLALKLFGNARHSHFMSHVFDEGLALFAGVNVIPKRSFLT